uniref:Beta-glucosidase n=1 Tax=Orpinomyces sp. (strain PC-2) TaxID=50059 RepID=Q9UUQ3_ORPSP|nr:beta-glucosidase [Orpinomyces sp. PC-2]
MKTLTVFSALLAVTAAKKCIVKSDAAVASEAEEVTAELTAPEDSGVESGEDDELLDLSTIDYGDDVDMSTVKKLPADFKWGAATAAYQVEGAWDEEGRGESVWDHFTHLYPKNVESGDRSKDFSTNGNIACDSYHKFDEDVKMLKLMNAKYYRFSISWPRLFPDGQARKVDGKWNVNEKGAEYYDMVINTLLKNDIVPFVTLYHWDLPYALHEKYGGWLDYHSQDDFAKYAEFCFERFGDRVKNWITINEPWVNCVSGYRLGPGKAPYRCTGEAPRKLQNSTDLDLEGGCSYEIGPTQYSKNSEPLPANRVPQKLEDVWCSHNILLGHAKAVKVYREKFQKKQKGLIGITVDGEAQIPWVEPGMTKKEYENNLKYANLAAEFRIGWYSDPPMVGDYPKSVKERMGKDLPEFTEEEKKILKGSSSDFLGWNTYTAHWAAQAKNEDGSYIQPPTAEEANFDNSKKDMWDDNCKGRGDGWTCIPPTLGSQAGSSWNTKFAPTIRVGLNWFSKRYEGLIKNGIVITENGCAQPNYKVARANDEVTKKYFESIGQPKYADTYKEEDIEREDNLEGTLMHDTYRIDWYDQYLKNLRLAYAVDNIDVRGYMAWSLLDNFEWENGYETRFGMTYIDFYNDKEMKRVPKDSLEHLGQWYLENVEQN